MASSWCEAYLEQASVSHGESLSRCLTLVSAALRWPIFDELFGGEPPRHDNVQLKAYLLLDLLSRRLEALTKQRVLKDLARMILDAQGQDLKNIVGDFLRNSEKLFPASSTHFHLYVDLVFSLREEAKAWPSFHPIAPCHHDEVDNSDMGNSSDDVALYSTDGTECAVVCLPGVSPKNEETQQKSFSDSKQEVGNTEPSPEDSRIVPRSRMSSTRHNWDDDDDPDGPWSCSIPDYYFRDDLPEVNAPYYLN